MAEKTVALAIDIIKEQEFQNMINEAEDIQDYIDCLDDYYPYYSRYEYL